MSKKILFQKQNAVVPTDLFLGGPLQGQQHVVVIFIPLKKMISHGHVPTWNLHNPSEKRSGKTTVRSEQL